MLHSNFYLNHINQTHKNMTWHVTSGRHSFFTDANVLQSLNPSGLSLFQLSCWRSWSHLEDHWSQFHSTGVDVELERLVSSLVWSWMVSEAPNSIYTWVNRCDNVRSGWILQCQIGSPTHHF